VGVVQWLSGFAVQAGLETGLPSASVFGRLHLAFGIVVLLASAVYVFAPPRPTSDPDSRSER
jgi:hypothetical protein